MNIDNYFSNLSDEKTLTSNAVFEGFPTIYKDERGGFFQKISQNHNSITPCLSWCKQVNHSFSKPGVFRGFHAQSGKYCQAKLVENCSDHGMIYDIIIDARPDSKTFGLSKIYRLYPITHERHNLLWIPRGFLHSFLTSKNTSDNLHFQYFVDNEYNKESEICINPNSVLQIILDDYQRRFDEAGTLLTDQCANDLLTSGKSEDLIISNKDKAGLDFTTWMTKIENDYCNFKTLWYRS